MDVMTLCATFNSPTGLGNSNFIGAGRYKPDQLTENVSINNNNNNLLLIVAAQYPLELFSNEWEVATLWFLPYRDHIAPSSCSFQAF